MMGFSTTSMLQVATTLYFPPFSILVSKVSPVPVLEAPVMTQMISEDTSQFEEVNFMGVSTWVVLGPSISKGSLVGVGGSISVCVVGVAGWVIYSYLAVLQLNIVAAKKITIVDFNNMIAFSLFLIINFELDSTVFLST